ncbi:D-beta-hydroxybutyrate dehydrogenase, mitochondrial [Alligator mississippiensis]|uniref:D-beta-hydroxybutyrate dehydrogenase, mitochondrial n=1 Tax=Alligator mississippiensis TaxID=8496 RepID=UPI0028776D69|nr:D-beta-hydroxybutyrate dehydrogenase, mitochondrial [Alligator mississippiensis]
MAGPRAARPLLPLLLLLLLALAVPVPVWVLVLVLVLVAVVVAAAVPRGALPVEGKAVLITGCDKGFGHALAKQLHAKGFTVFAGCLQTGENGARELESMQSDRMKVLQLNVCSDQEVAQAVDFVKKKLKEPEKGLWGVVNNAGVTTFGDVEFTHLDKYREVADINLWGTVRVTQAFLPLVRRARGRVVNVSSMYGRIVSPSRSCYCVSKFGVSAFSDCLRQEMYRWGVRVILIEPGNFMAATGILTRDGVDARGEELWRGASKTVQEDYGKAYITHQITQMKSFVGSGLKDMSLVLNDITDALVSKRPYNRYNPMSAYWWVKLHVMAHLPTAIADWLYIR